ncbi:hypothetical protein DEO72_LG7g2996 [Vigna unguiculata]|uniref:Uncharacterized protein n=1 Tax=Vigna unguiculata TaxID=3917 RepID=A0A4D6MNZ4_VIGUN|nr:hypothetical protein DEO72_LG4g1288 [Vigna unguiculata]QCE01697.1 hypothetical protein DEO72_LG7g2996 [Vigna unguiculata]
MKDFFSLLPLELLVIIISLLPFKEAVKSSVLFKNLLKASKFTKNVEFNELFFVKPDQSDETRQVQRRVFIDFIKTWIENHKGTVLDKFSLKMSTQANVGEVIDQCVGFATQRNVKELTLDFADSEWEEHDVYFGDYDAIFDMPKQVYAHSGLEHLKLYSCCFIEAEMRNFHVLKEVSLGWMKLSVTAIKGLLSNCRVLESLSMKRCWSSERFRLGQEETKGLKMLVIDHCRFEFDVFIVNALNLQIFKYYGWMNFNIMEIQSPEMEEADLDFAVEYSYHRRGYPLYNMMKNLSIASILTVCSYVLQVIPSGPEQLRMEHDMCVQHLIMNASLHEDEFIGIAFFINSCPMLGCLTIQICPKNDLSDCEEPFYFNLTRFWADFLGDCECLRSSLEEVEFDGYRGHKNENLLLEYLIIKGFVLKSISINLMKDDSGMIMESHSRQHAEDLLQVQRASKNLEITIS